MAHTYDIIIDEILDAINYWTEQHTIASQGMDVAECQAHCDDFYNDMIEASGELHKLEMELINVRIRQSIMDAELEDSELAIRQRRELMAY